MDERTEQRSAAAKFVADMETLELENMALREQLRKSQQTANENATHADTLTRLLKDAQAGEQKWHGIATELAAQVRINVAGNVRALELAAKCDEARTAFKQAADVEKLLMSSVYGRFNIKTSDITEGLKHPEPCEDEGCPHFGTTHSHAVGDYTAATINRAHSLFPVNHEGEATRRLREMEIVNHGS